LSVKLRELSEANMRLAEYENKISILGEEV